LFLGFDAAKPAVVHGALRDYAIVHIATHGVVDSAHPERSGLILSLVDRHGRPRPGLLSLDDIYRLNLNADLVTISACETALGREVRGEGLFSLTRGFLYAGANRVLATLWRVDDEATSDLLRNFYRALFQNPACTPATALRRAQLATMAQPRWRSPFYWAGFVLQGQP
jgi:CHAT domain-containing protein